MASLLPLFPGEEGNILVHPSSNRSSLIPSSSSEVMDPEEGNFFPASLPSTPLTSCHFFEKRPMTTPSVSLKKRRESMTPTVTNILCHDQPLMESSISSVMEFSLRSSEDSTKSHGRRVTMREMPVKSSHSNTSSASIISRLSSLPPSYLDFLSKRSLSSSLASYLSSSSLVFLIICFIFIPSSCFAASTEATNSSTSTLTPTSTSNSTSSPIPSSNRRSYDDEDFVGSNHINTRTGRPFYNIAHMVNSIKEINYYLSRGANAIEADVAFSPNGTALYTFHGYPCDCFRHCTEREDIGKYLEYVREVTRPDSPYFKRQLALLFLDLKISGLPPSAKAVAGQDLAAKVIEYLFGNGESDTQVNLLMSIGHIYDSDFVLGFQNELESRDLASNLSSRIGWDVGLNDPVSSIVSMWRRIEVINNIWQGDGRSNCISPFYNLGRLTTVIERRDERNEMIDDPYIDKVYHWTIDLTHNLRASLRTGVDGIITNHPERLVSILRETEFSKIFRMADQEDDPWQRIQAREDFKPSPAAPVTQPVSARWASGFGDMITSFAKYLRDFVYLRVPSYHNIS